MSNIQNVQQTRDEIGSEDTVGRIFPKFSEIATLLQGPTVHETRDITSSTLWDQNNWDAEDSVWNEAYSTGFILGSAVSGVLGVNKLGDSGAELVVHAVTNPSQRYLWKFGTSQLGDVLFKDTDNTTATWAGDQQLVFSVSEEVAQSTEVFYNNQTVDKATMEITGTDTDNGDYFMSADGGTNWEEVTPGVEHTFTNTGQDLRFKIDNNNAEEAPWGSPWGSPWSEAPTPGAMTITKIIIRYEVA